MFWRKLKLLSGRNFGLEQEFLKFFHIFMYSHYSITFSINYTKTIIEHRDNMKIEFDFKMKIRPAGSVPSHFEMLSNSLRCT